MNRFFKILVMGLLVLTGAFFIYNSSNLEPSANSNVIPVYTYKVINAYPHDRSDTRSLDFKTKYYLLFHNMKKYEKKKDF